MRLILKNSSDSLARTTLLVVFAAEGARPALPKGVKIPRAALDEFKGEFRESRLSDAGAGGAARVLLVGLGEAKAVDAEKLRRVAAIAVRKAESIKAESCALHVAPAVAKLAGGAEVVGQALAEGAVMGHYRYDGGKSKPEERKLKRTLLYADGAPFRRGAKLGKALGEANLFTRDLQNRAGNQLTPRMMAAEARKLARLGARVSCKVLDEPAMKKLGMGLLLGVSAGSREPARLIHLVYKPKGRSKGRIALVGKGLTFDAGGISLKPARGMEEMRYDMSGGAAVLGAFHALTAVDVPYEVHGIVPSSENLPDGLATKPGDIHTGMDGTTVEIGNTDAEGRLILADALTYTVKKVKPETILDVATLTGAVVMGLGHEVCGIYPTTDKLRDALVAAGDACGERPWPMPLLEQFTENLKRGPADLSNMSTPDMGGGSIAGAMFLKHFVGETEWCHLDIAGTAWNQKDRDYTGGKGGSGFGARLFLQWLRR